MPETIVPPRERTCLQCGRADVWDDAVENWRIATIDGEKRIGTPHCIHEWNINGTYNPFEA
ncbi:HEWD family protein [Haladaptatus sp. DJG-WS-42]|uniref:HEWD family protein n=1 Tax=Haladaptatus sp. DJG-WS-42 TaxID=3120516 RepID=UPI0030D2BAA5